METTTCSRCDDGFVTYEEDGRLMTDSCLHCGETGLVDCETSFHDTLTSACMMLGYLGALAYQVSCDEDPEGDGFGLCAAENGMTVSEYRTVLSMEGGDRALGVVGEWDRNAQEWLVAFYGWPTRALAAESPELSFPEASFDDVACDDNELPF